MAIEKYFQDITTQLTQVYQQAGSEQGSDELRKDAQRLTGFISVLHEASREQNLEALEIFEVDESCVEDID